MRSIRDLYKIGKGPSSSHTMGPERAARIFLQENPDAERFEVILYGSLSKTGVGHHLLHNALSRRTATDVSKTDEEKSFLCFAHIFLFCSHVCRSCQQRQDQRPTCGLLYIRCRSFAKKNVYIALRARCFLNINCH